MSDAATTAPQHAWTDLGGPLHYVRYGTAPGDGVPIVLVHGLGGSHANWAVLGPLLAAGTSRPVVAPDLPAHGYTPAAGRDTSLRGLREVLHRFVVEVAGGSCVLVGHSLGGALTALQAATDPGVVSRLALIDPAMPPGLPPRMHPAVLAAFAAYALPGAGQAAVRQRTRRLAPEQAVELSLRWICQHPERVPADAVEQAAELLRRVEDGAVPGAAARQGRREATAAAGRRSTPDEAAFLVAARSLIAMMLSPRAYPSLLARIDVPTLVLHGERDRYVPLASVARASRRYGWELHVAADAGHAPQLEAAPWVSGHLLRWLG